ncbi:MAG: hypothetical protein IJS88_06815 [Alphaproteobacteria bacterium]|nr:hypothetical protein [Alphaproteobacteria bacterium]
MKQSAKNCTTETFKLLWQFKWYIVAYLLFYSMFIIEYFNPPAADDPILNYEYTHGAWNYINQEVYIHSMKLYSIIDTLIFFIGTSNMRNHPLLAKIIFLSPWIVMLLGILVITCKELFGLSN